ncbi:MAG: hypothetical protein ABSE47_14965 [Acidimicrobiales bacterium]
MKSIMIVVVLAVVWIVALTPMIVRKISERQFTSGVRSYHRRLLRFGTSGEHSVVAEGAVGSVPGAMIGFSAAAQRLHVERYGVPAPSAEDFEYDRVHAAPVAAVTFSPATAARRRHVMLVLGGATVFFFVVGMIPAARVMWDLALFSLGCTVAYVALLIHFHRVAVERAQKVIALETRRQATAVLESRRHVVAHRARNAVSGGFGSGGYARVGSTYASASGAIVGGSGWSVMGVQQRRSAAH